MSNLSQTLTEASANWAARPDDERFTSLPDMLNVVSQSRENSRERTTSSRNVSFVPATDNRGLLIAAPDGRQLDVTHWAFGQAANLAGAPAGYLRTLPAPMAADCLNYGLKIERAAKDVGLLIERGETRPTLRAATGPNYGRIWNDSIVRALISNFGDGITGHFRVPGEFGKAVQVTKANTTLYASDRDMFVFLADETNRIEMPNRRDGKSGSLARGFFVWNSEVGSATFGVKQFLFDYVCCNRIVWGASDIKEIRIRHTASAPHKFLDEIAPLLEDYSHASPLPVQAMIANAQARKIENVDEFLKARFSRVQTSAINAAHFSDEQRPIETLWDAATGITAYARSIAYQDDRVALETEAGKILNLAA